MKTEELKIRLSVEEKELLREQAKSAGLSVSEYVRNWIVGSEKEARSREAAVLERDFINKSNRKKVVAAKKELSAKEAVKKAEKIKASPFKSYFKDDKLNK